METNADVLKKAALKWVAIFDFEGGGSRPKTLPLKLVVAEVDWISSAFFQLSFHSKLETKNQIRDHQNNRMS